MPFSSTLVHLLIYTLFRVLVFVCIYRLTALDSKCIKTLRNLNCFTSIIFLKIFYHFIQQCFVVFIKTVFLLYLLDQLLTSLNLIQFINIRKRSTTALASLGLIAHNSLYTSLATNRWLNLPKFFLPCTSFSGHTLKNVIEHCIKRWLLSLVPLRKR